MSETSDGPLWICANCGARHDSNDPPCRECASEQFAKLEPSETERLDSTNRVTWICQDCGTSSPRNNSPCRECGGFDYVKIDTDSATAGYDGSDVPDEPAGDSNRKRDYYIGVVLGVVGVLVFPYFFFLVALPEALFQLGGRSLQDVLGGDARDNPYLSGSMLIMRWFGNFLILTFVLGFLLGLLFIFG